MQPAIDTAHSLSHGLHHSYHSDVSHVADVSSHHVEARTPRTLTRTAAAASHDQPLKETALFAPLSPNVLRSRPVASPPWISMASIHDIEEASIVIASNGVR